jgi:hypothetical protein
LYDWAVHHGLSGWQAKSWPAEIDVFLAVGELALYVAYLDGWPARQRIWLWTTALTGLAVSIAGNIGHIQAMPGHPVILADRLTAATSPIAAFAGLSVGLLVLKMTRPRSHVPVQEPRLATALVLAPPPATADVATGVQPGSGPAARLRPSGQAFRYRSSRDPRPGVLRDATAIYRDAAARGERLSQRTLARQLRGHGHRFPNEHLRLIADSIGLNASTAARPAERGEGERGAAGERHHCPSRAGSHLSGCAGGGCSAVQVHCDQSIAEVPHRGRTVR